jgi:hypothetical protein
MKPRLVADMLGLYMAGGASRVTLQR